jgi:hypothetical protein
LKYVFLYKSYHEFFIFKCIWHHFFKEKKMFIKTNHFFLALWKGQGVVKIFCYASGVDKLLFRFGKQVGYYTKFKKGTRLASVYMDQEIGRQVHQIAMISVVTYKIWTCTSFLRHKLILIRKISMKCHVKYYALKHSSYFFFLIYFGQNNLQYYFTVAKYIDFFKS